MNNRTNQTKERLLRMDKAEVIRQLVEAGRARHVLELLEGESEYTTSDSEGVPPDEKAARLWIGALHYLRWFVSEFDAQRCSRTIGKQAESPLPESFAGWLNAGAPGIGAADLSSYLTDHPLP